MNHFDDTQYQIAQKRMTEIASVLEGETTDYNDDTIKRFLLECIRVIDKHTVEFQFKRRVNLTETV